MNKILYVIAVLALASYADEIKIDFKETRYIEAFNEKVVKKGVISFSNEQMKILYLPPHEREITLQNNQITIKNGDDIIIKEAREEPNITNMFTIFDALFKNNEERLKRFFKVVKKTQNEVVLSGISSSNPISKLTYEIKDGDIVKFELLGQNGDRITIDVVKKR